MRVVMEIDTSDLPAFHEGPGVETPGAGKQNVWCFLNDMLVCGVLEKRIQYMSDHHDENPVIYEAVMRVYKEEEKLARRLVESVKIE